MNEPYINMLGLYRALIETYKNRYDIELICHYIDEIPLARRDFENIPLRYSFDASDYFDLYRRYDYVVGPRVHGIGAAASVGVPGLAFLHDYRGSTCEGFLAELVTNMKDGPGVLAALEKGIAEAAAKSQSLSQHKKATMEAYVNKVRENIPTTTEAYGAPELIQRTTKYSLNDFGQIFQALFGSFKEISKSSIFKQENL